LTLFNKLPQIEAAPVFEPIQALELSPKNPQSDLILGSDGNFYGTTSGGEEGSGGTVFKMPPAGELTTLATFSWSGAYNPQAKLFQDADGNFYGTTCKSGGGYGTVFKIRTPDLARAQRPLKPVKSGLSLFKAHEPLS